MRPVKGTVKTMRATRRDFTRNVSPWRKAVAVIASVALVSSMSNVQAFGVPEDEAPVPDETVIVRFEVDPGVVVHVAGKDITHGTDDPTFKAQAAHNLSFTVDPRVEGGVAYKVGTIEYTFGEARIDPSKESDSPQVVEAQPPAAEDDSSTAAAGEGSDGDSSTTGDSREALNDISVPDPRVTPDDTGDEGPYTVMTFSVPEKNEVELSDELTPLAATSGQEGAERVSGEGAPVEEVGGQLLLSREVLSSAAAENKEVVVRVSSTPIKETVSVSSEDELREYLGKEDMPVEIKLDQSITVNALMTVKGEKSIELNGNTITAGGGLKGGNLFIVSSESQLFLTDAPSRAIEPWPTAIESTTSAGKHADSDVAKLGSYDSQSLVLTYYVSTSEPDRATGTTQEERMQLQVEMSAAGAIVGSELNALVKVEEEGAFSMEGGRLSNTDGAHGIEASGKASVAVTGGFIVGNGAQADGAGIYFAGNDKNSSRLTIGGTAIVGGNKTSKKEESSSRNNGGGIWVQSTTLVIEGSAVVAGNYAGAEGLVVNGGGPDNTNVEGYVSGRHYEKNNGGGVYVGRNSDFILRGKAQIAGNRAASDGGGVYVQPSERFANSNGLPSNSFTMDDEAVISNNMAMRDMSAWNPATSKQPNESWWFIYTGGGGGIFSMGTTSIKSGQLVNNYAADGGGALLLPQGRDEASPELFIEYAVVAGNYCETSEGGGIHCQPKAVLDGGGHPVSGNSYIKTGYITNNATATVFDYGGGGMFIVSGGYLRVYSPLVTANTADGWGGGVAACTNGTIITSDAAIFDNTANQEGHTTNMNEFGDAWAADRTYWSNKNFSEIEGSNALPANASDDFFCAKQSIVYNDMLGGGDYNWNGYMSGRATTVIEYNAWGQPSQNKLTYYIAKTTQQKTVPVFSANMEENLDTWDVTKLEVYKAGVNKYAYMYVSENIDVLKNDLMGSFVHLKGSNFQKADSSSGSIRKAEDGVVLAVEDGKDDVTKDGVTYKKVLLYLDTTGEKPELFNAQPGGGIYSEDGLPTGSVRFYKTLEAQLKVGATSSTSYNVYKIEQFPTNGYAEATRFMALKAYPIKDGSESEAKQAAFDKATVFFTGNYSDNNGGGIGCNGKIVIGRDHDRPGNDDPKLPEDKYWNLTINKAWSNLGSLDEEQTSTLTAAFKVRAYKDKNAYSLSKTDNSIKPVFETIIGMTFDKGSEAEQTRVLENLKEGWYVVVEEISIPGDNFEVDSAEAKVLMDANTTVKFTNTYTPEGSCTTGVVNSYTADESATETGGVRVDQDTVYKRTHSDKAQQDQPQDVTPEADPVVAQAGN